MKHFFVYLFLLTGLCLPLPASAQIVATASPSDSLAKPDTAWHISLLTCSPGQEVYELYGHTALRVRHAQRGLDVVFNYGAFDFRAPHFVWRFVLGECDYMLFPEPLLSFLNVYYARGSEVIEQELNLRGFEADSLAASLFRESQPDMRVYRYNIFRSNCTTRARDKIESCIDGFVVYPVRARRNTFRSILHEFTRGHEWAREGNDLLLGADVDTLITERDEMFAPIYLMNYVDSAMIDAGRYRLRPLVRERRVLLKGDAARRQASEARQPSFPLPPAVCWWGLLLAGLALGLFEWRRQRVVWAVDAVLMTLQGVAGLLLTFMSLCSQHPGVAPNWQVWILNPLPLFFVWSVVRAARKQQFAVYHVFAAIMLLLFLALYVFIPQHFSQLLLPLALLLLSRASVHFLVYHKK